MARIRPLESFRWTEQEREFYLQELLKAAKPVEQVTMGTVPAGDHLEQALERLQHGDRLVGVSSGYASIDKLTRGMAPGELTVMYGMTSHGKSQMAQNMAVMQAKAGIKSMFVSLEMTPAENTGRLFQMAQLDPQEFRKLPIIYPDTTELGLKDIDSMFDSAKENGCQVLYFDHLHYLNRSISNQQEEIGIIVNNFKRAAVRTNIHCVLISHVVKAIKQSEIPKPEHLKGSSFIAQDADMLLAIWRDTEQTTGEVLVKISKNRNRGFVPEESIARLYILDQVRLSEGII